MRYKLKKKRFDRGFDVQWSTETTTITNIKLPWYLLLNGKQKRASDLQKVVAPDTPGTCTKKFKVNLWSIFSLPKKWTLIYDEFTKEFM